MAATVRKQVRKMLNKDVSRDVRAKNYKNKSSRDNRRDVFLHIFTGTPLLENKMRRDACCLYYSCWCTYCPYHPYFLIYSTCYNYIRGICMQALYASTLNYIILCSIPFSWSSRTLALSRWNASIHSLLIFNVFAYIIYHLSFDLFFIRQAFLIGVFPCKAIYMRAEPCLKLHIRSFLMLSVCTYISTSRNPVLNCKLSYHTLDKLLLWNTPGWWYCHLWHSATHYIQVEMYTSATVNDPFDELGLVDTACSWMPQVQYHHPGVFHKRSLSNRMGTKNYICIPFLPPPPCSRAWQLNW